jgi:hypothetical protein
MLTRFDPLLIKLWLARQLGVLIDLQVLVQLLFVYATFLVRRPGIHAVVELVLLRDGRSQLGWSVAVLSDLVQVRQVPTLIRRVAAFENLRWLKLRFITAVELMN